MAQARGTQPARKAASNTPSGARKGMPAGPNKPSARLVNPAKPVVAKGPVAGAKTNPKAQPMYTGKPSKAAKMPDQYGTGLTRGGRGKGYQDQAPRRATTSKPKYNQG